MFFFLFFPFFKKYLSIKYWMADSEKIITFHNTWFYSHKLIESVNIEFLKWINFSFYCILNTPCLYIYIILLITWTTGS